MLWRFAAVLLALGSVIAQYPLEQGIVPNDQYTAAPAAAPLGAQGWRTGRSTFFDGSDTFKNAYIARYMLMSALIAVPSSPCAIHVCIGPHDDTSRFHTVKVNVCRSCYMMQHSAVLTLLFYTVLHSDW